MKKAVLVLIVAIIMMTMVGVSAFAAAPPKETYGMVVFLKGSEFFNWCYAGFKDSAAIVGAKTELMGPADWNAADEAKAVEQLLAKKVKGIAVTAGDADTLVGSINKAINAKVPCLTFDSDSPKSKRMLFVGTDHYNAGYQAGLVMGQLLGNNGKVGISMIPGLNAIEGRIAGFEAGLKKAAPSAKIVTKVNDEGDLQKAETVNTAMLQANPQINGIFCAHGNPATGAYKATVNVGRNKGDKKVLVMGFAIDVPVLQMVERGELVGTVAQKPYNMGVMSFWCLYAAAHPTQFQNFNYPGFGNVPTATLDTGVKILLKGDPMIKALMTPPSLK